MLSLESIRQSYPENLHAFGSFLLREYLQHVILEIVYEGPHASQLIFLGGTNLRIIHGNQRFSEDLDFDHFDLSPTAFEEVAANITQQLQARGFQAEIKLVMRGAWHCHIKFPAMLYQQGLSGHIEEKILIQLDTEAHGYSYSPDQPLINRLGTFFQPLVTPMPILLSQKCYAILNRKRNKGRDFYDVVFLLSKNVIPDYSYLEMKVNHNSPESLREALLNHCSTLDMHQMAEDVQPFLFHPAEVKKVKLFTEVIKGADLG